MSENWTHLVELAKKNREHAYCPYSKYKVGAAVMAESGQTYGGCNVENMAYGSTVCAERIAIFKGVSEGERVFKALALVTEDGGMPCGSCLQVMQELTPDATIIVADMHGNTKVYTMSDLLPLQFHSSLL